MVDEMAFGFLPKLGSLLILALPNLILSPSSVAIQSETPVKQDHNVFYLQKQVKYMKLKSVQIIYQYNQL